MHIEQRLTTCEVCCRVLAIQYEWNADRWPELAQERICQQWFACPACKHQNPMLLLMYAHPIVVKLVPGPEPDPRARPNSLRRMWLKEAERDRPPRPQRSSRLPLLVGALAPVVLRWLKYEQWLVWTLSRIFAQ